MIETSMNAFADVFARLDAEAQRPETQARRPQYDRIIRDVMTKEGAERLKGQLERFWGAHSDNRDAVHFRIEWTGQYCGREIWCVRSNLVNGLPAR